MDLPPQPIPTPSTADTSTPGGELRAKEAFNFSLFQHTPVPTTVVDAQGRVVKSNLARRSAPLALPGLGRPLFDDGSAPYPAFLQGALQECIRAGRERVFEAVRVADRVLRIRMAPLDGGALVVFEDVVARPEAFREIVTANPVMLAIFRYVEAIAPTDQPALITGETGVGKELIAKAVHTLSGRSGRFIAVNIAGLDDTLFSDTLFGHRKGAFTGASGARDGLIEKASGGTLFLDEIGDLGIASQVKLLRLLQEREYFPLGTDDPRRTTARVLVATNRSVEDLIRADNFRKDLYFRLRSHHVHVPPLRERADDLPLLLDHFLKRASEAMGRERPTYPEELITMLRNYAFPGNVRELQSMVCNAVTTHSGGVLSLETFKHGMQAARSAPPADAYAPGAPVPFALAQGARLPTLAEAEDLLIAEALRRTNGNQTLAASLLGITRQTINRRRRKTPKR